MNSAKFTKRHAWKVMLIISLLLVPQATLALSVNTTTDGSLLATTILGSGITISNVSYTGATNQSGLFTEGIASGIGIEDGIILTSGNANLAVGPNTLNDTTSEIGTPGDSDLEGILPFPLGTNDATILEFDFVSAGGDLFFDYVFASEEYNEFANTFFNDVFAFFLDGSNIALIPGTSDPVSVDNVNGGNPFGVGAVNPQFYNNNNPDDGGPFFDIEYDGFTDVFTAQFLDLTPGTHRMKIALADVGDEALDSAVFIKSGSFSDTMDEIPPMDPPPNPIPEPATILLFGTGLLTLVSWRLTKWKK